MDDILLDLLTYECPNTGVKRVAGSGPLEPEDSKSCGCKKLWFNIPLVFKRYQNWSSKKLWWSSGRWSQPSRLRCHLQKVHVTFHSIRLNILLQSSLSVLNELARVWHETTTCSFFLMAILYVTHHSISWAQDWYFWRSTVHGLLQQGFRQRKSQHRPRQRSSQAIQEGEESGGRMAVNSKPLVLKNEKSNAGLYNVVIWKS